ncbi:hypothetical protein EC973_007422 [Apophysomyces ossiformis]|uniref:Uncharacterized protein n=1 Tax=Apophysomyces ossiformis TaxID=679940 RepID=A0A8H7EQF9_9FUNG|nr:hypothetical protein EC973_007408 [Apophysomyces ossiformis]KAF7727548.1 hypothetical protein EC973_007422 [Apophysomyces ossiformis]
MKRRSFTVLPLFAVAMAMLSSSADALDHPKFLKAGRNVVPGRYMVEFEGNARYDEDELVHSFSKDFKKAKVHISEKFNHELFNGVSFQLSGLDDADHTKALKAILERDDVKHVFPVTSIPRPSVQPLKTDASRNVATWTDPHHMTQVDRVHKELKNKGKGIVVGVLDSGVDYLHPALGGGFGKGYKVRYGYDLVGDKYDSNDDHPIVRPGPTPLDNCGAKSNASGHGTHVSGIIAGYDPKTGYTGVAPEATLGMWRVFGCSGSTGNDIIIKALLMAYDAGVDLISMSLGDTSAWSEGGETHVVQRIVEQGVPVIVAAGNAGSEGVYTVGRPSTTKDSTAVASYDNYHFIAKLFENTVFPGTSAYLPATSALPPNGVPLVAGDKNIGSKADGCSADSVPDDVKGKIALLQRGSCTFDIKAKNVADKGAVGLLVYNSFGDAMGVASFDDKFPVAGIAHDVGEKLLAAVKKGEKVTFTFHKEDKNLKLSTGTTTSSFSSTGATYELDLKPNLGGVGGLVYSTLPRYLGSWGLMSGTSMATPYVSGAVALYMREIGKKQSPKYITEQFQNYALVTPRENGKKELDSPLRQGAGLIQVYDTIKNQIHITPGQISFNDTSSNQYKTHTIKITNHGHKTVSYEVVNKVSLTVVPYDLKTSGYTPLEPAEFTKKGGARLRFSKTHFRLAPGKTETVKVTVIPPKVNPKEHLMYGGFVEFKVQQKSAGVKDVHVPYFGVAGKQRDLPIFDPKYKPFVTDYKGAKVYTAKDTYVFDRSNVRTTPFVVFRLVTATAELRPEIIDAKTNKVVGYAFNPIQYLQRNNLARKEYQNVQTWDGTYVPTFVPDSPYSLPVKEGTYKIRFQALKLLGDPKKAKDWETWESGLIQVKN